MRFLVDRSVPSVSFTQYCISSLSCLALQFDIITGGSSNISFHINAYRNCRLLPKHARHMFRTKIRAQSLNELISLWVISTIIFGTRQFMRNTFLHARKNLHKCSFKPKNLKYQKKSRRNISLIVISQRKARRLKFHTVENLSMTLDYYSHSKLMMVRNAGVSTIFLSPVSFLGTILTLDRLYRCDI